MKQVLRKGLKEIVVEEVPDPMVTAHHVLVRPSYSLISSGTETASIHTEGLLQAVANNRTHIGKVLELMRTNGPVATLREVRAKFTDCAALGYAGAGVVVEKHPTVTDLNVGDRVAYGGEGTGHAETTVVGRNLLARVPNDVPMQYACFTTLGSIALNATRIANISLGDRVVVMGLGLVGQLVAQMARLQGAAVIATDLKPHRVELARQLGAQYALESGDSALDKILAVTDGKGADCVILAAAAPNSAAPCQQALHMCRERGRIVVLGAVALNLPWHQMYLKEIKLLMARAYGPGSYDDTYENQGIDYPYAYVRWTENRNMEEFLRLVARREVNLSPLISNQFPLADAANAYATIMDPAAETLAVLLAYPDSSPAITRQFHPKRRVDTSPRSASRDQIGIALVGPGNIARWAHLPLISKHRGVTLRAVHSSNGVRGKNIGARFGAGYCSTDYQQILDDPTVHAVLITSRNAMHAPQAISALRAGKSVFIEKPMALTERECIDLCRESSQIDAQFTVGFNRRHAPLYKTMKHYLSERLGPAVLNIRVNSPGIAGSYWMADPAIGGALLGEGCHFVDLMYWLLQAEPLSVSAFCLPTNRKHPIGQDNLVASFRFSDDSVASLTYCTVGNRASAGERVEAYAEGIAVTLDNFNLLTNQSGLLRRKRSLFVDKGYGRQMGEFINCVQNGKAPEITARDGARATIVCLKMMESCLRQKPVDIDLDQILS